MYYKTSTLTSQDTDYNQYLEAVKTPHIQFGQDRSSAGQIIEFNDLAFYM
jgi:hypothetical protein